MSKDYRITVFELIVPKKVVLVNFWKKKFKKPIVKCHKKKDTNDSRKHVFRKKNQSQTFAGQSHCKGVIDPDQIVGSNNI